MPLNEPGKGPDPRSLGEIFEEWSQGTKDLVATGVGLARRVGELRRIARTLAGLVFILLLVCGFLQWQLVQRQNAFKSTVIRLDFEISQLQATSDGAKQAAVDAKTALDAAIAKGGSVDPATSDAIRKINELYTVCVHRNECQAPPPTTIP